VVVQCPPAQQVVQVIIRPSRMTVCVVQAHAADAAVARTKAATMRVMSASPAA
jgi:hypothetical protein